MNNVVCKMIYDIIQVPISIFSKTESIFFPSGEGIPLTEQMNACLRESTEPVIFQESVDIYYGLMQSDDVQYLIGPVSSRVLTPMELHAYREAHHLKQELGIKRMRIDQLAKVLVLLYWNLTREELPYSKIQVVGNTIDLGNTDWSSLGEYETYQLDQSEYGRVHTGGMEFENRILECVKTGNVVKIKELFSGQTPNAHDYSEVAKSNRKQFEFLLISTLTLVTRAAVSGGMNPEEAYTLGDVYMRRIEECLDDLQELTKLGIRAQIEFTEKVYLAKKNRTGNLYVEKCKDYIAKNLRKNIKVGDIAPEIGVSRTYLTHKFTELEGVTIQQYIMKEKCEHASNLLKYSDYSISAIAEYFGFTSQSHFGSCFRREFGVPPGEYRNRNIGSYVARRME